MVTIPEDRISIYQDPSRGWVVYIPGDVNDPKAKAIPGDSDSDDLGPYGDSYWTSFLDAVEFVAHFLVSKCLE